jgi:ubiquinone/menaquinone biosynthesis C-methylase UbiE
LDIATGIGEPAVIAARKVMPNGKAIVIDISPQMLEIAKTRAKSLSLDAIMEFRESDGEKLDLLEPRARFNAILSRWGLMLLPNLDSALGRIRQILVTTAVTLLLYGLLLPRFHCLIWLSQQ